MASLTGNSIATSYAGLLKTSNNGAITATLTNVTDGEGNATPLSMANNYVQLQAPTIELIESTGGTNLMQITPTNVYFEGAVDFGSATVTGLPGGGGLELGSGAAINEGAPKSMQSGLSVATVTAQARGGGDIAIGENAVTPVGGPDWPTWSIAIGGGATVTSEKGLAIGFQASAASKSVAVGFVAGAGGTESIAIGDAAVTDSIGNIAIGNGATSLGGGGYERTNICIGNGLANNERSIAIGHSVNATGGRSIAMSEGANASGLRSIAIGQSSQSQGFNSTVVGAYSKATAEGSFALGGYNAWALNLYSGALGRESTANLDGAVAIGYQVTSAWAYATTVNRLAMQDVANLNYADQPTAVANGVPVGGVYHTDGTLKIVY